MPTVGWVRTVYVGGLIELVVDVLVDDAGLADGLVPQQHYFDLDLAADRAHGVVHLRLK